MARQFSTRLTRQALREQLASPLPDRGDSPENASFAAAPGGDDSQSIRNWLTELHLLKGVPFNYLVADMAMLPAESLRFFQVDNAWLDCLLDGAFSLGSAGVAPQAASMARDTFHDAARDQARSAAVRRAMRAEQRSQVIDAGAALDEQAVPLPREHLSGFLLRSALVSGWPGLEVEGYADSQGNHALSLVRLEQVAPALLLGLFNGVVAQVRFKAPGEAVHFGVSVNDQGNCFKTLRRLVPSAEQGVGSYTDTRVDVDFRDKDRRVLSLASLARRMGEHSERPLTAAGFALNMVEGVEVVSFAWERP